MSLKKASLSLSLAFERDMLKVFEEDVDDLEDFGKFV